MTDPVTTIAGMLVLAQETAADRAADEGLLVRALNSQVSFWFILFAFIILIVLIRSVASVAKTNARERTRREIAAYIAEGSMSPDQGERLMNAGPKSEC